MGNDLTGELRDSLAVIHSSVALLRRRLPPDDPARTQLERIVRHLDKMTLVLSQLEHAREG